MNHESPFPARAVPTKYDDKKKEFTVEYKVGGQEQVDESLVQEALIKENELRNEAEGYHDWIAKAITEHMDSPGWLTEVLVHWENGASTWEPLKTVRKANPLLLAQYAITNNLMQKKGWKWANRFKHPPKFIMNGKRVDPTTFRTPKYQFGVELPRNIKHALETRKTKTRHGTMPFKPKEIRYYLWPRFLPNRKVNVRLKVINEFHIIGFL